AGAAGDRLLLRPHLDPAGSPPALLPVGRDLLDPGAVRDAELAAAVDRRRHAVDPRRLAERVDGTVPRLRRRPAALAPAPDRLCDAGVLHRGGVGGRQPAAVAA